MSLNEIISEAEKFNCDLIEVTGGEPLMQEETPELINKLLEKNYSVLLETSGACDISSISPEAVRIVDMKCPGSGMVDKNDYSNLGRLTDNDELKFVVAGKDDFIWACNLLKEYDLVKRQNNFISPVHDQVNLEDLATWILESDINLRLQIQLHKVIWGPDKTGI